MYVTYDLYRNFCIKRLWVFILQFLFCLKEKFNRTKLFTARARRCKYSSEIIIIKQINVTVVDNKKGI